MAVVKIAAPVYPGPARARSFEAAARRPAQTARTNADRDALLDALAAEVLELRGTVAELRAAAGP